MYIQEKRQVKIPLGFWFSYSPKQILFNNLDLKHATVINNKVMFSTKLTAMHFSTVIIIIIMMYGHFGINSNIQLISEIL